MGHNGSKRSPVPETEDRVMKDLEKATSLEVDESTIDGDVDLGGGLTVVGKKRKDGRGSVDENGASTKRILRSNCMKMHVDAETAGSVALDVCKGDSLEKKQCDIIAKGDRGGVLTVGTCNAEEDREVIDVVVSDAVVESVRCSANNVESLGLAEVEIAEGNGLDANIQESDGKVEKADDKMSTPSEEQNESGAGTSVGGINDSQENKGINGLCQGEVIDPLATANGDELNMRLSRSNLTSGRESIEQEDTVMCTSDDQKVESHCQFDDKHKEAEISQIECTVDNHIMLTDSDCTNQKKGMDSPVNETKGDSTPDIVFIRRKSITRKTCEAKQVKSEDEVQFEKRVTRSATVRQREVSASMCVSATNDANLESKESKEDVLHHYTRKMGSTVRSKVHHTGVAECDTDTKKKLKGNVTTRRNSEATGNDNPPSITQNKESETHMKINIKSQPLTRRGSIVNKTEDAVSGLDQNVCSSAITDKNDIELTDSEGVKSENKTTVRKSILSVGAKIVASKKRILESGLDKTGGESPVAIPSLKKARDTSSDTELEQPKESSGKKLTRNNCGSDKKGMSTRRRHQSQTSKLSTSVNHSNKNESKLSQNESDDDGTGSDTSLRNTYVRRTRSGGIVPRKQEDSSESEEPIIVRKNHQRGKYSGKRAGSTPRHPSGSSSHVGKSALTKSEHSSFSRQAEKGKVNRKEVKASSLKSSDPSEQINTGSLREEKQKISDHIKGMLLDAGWTIDLRPRNGRNYLDSVYIPPSGKGSYWSVTKAYAVFLEGMESEQKGRAKDQRPSKKSAGSPGKSHVSEEILSKLKRIVVNKRRTKVELQKLKKRKHGLLKKQKTSKGKSRGSKNKISNSRKLHLGSERKKRGGCALLARGSNKEGGSGTNGFVPYEWKRTVLSWLIDLDIIDINAKLKCVDETHSKILLEGVTTRDGINCSCCSKVFPVLEFVAHAGGPVSKPYRSVLVDGLDTDLLHCLVNAWDKQSDSERQAFFPISTETDDPNDDTCGICGDGGNLICCDGCPSTFHMSCLELEEYSSQDAQDIADIDSSLCTCSQCEEKYHPGCSPETTNISSVSSQAGDLFCQQSCRLLFEGLRNLLAVKKDLEPEFSCRIIQRIHEDVPETVVALDERVECNSKIAVALSLMDECFLPIIDQRTGINLIRNVVYNCGSNFVRMDFRGFYIFVLERGDEIIAAASVRIHGTKLAEMPFIGTRNMYRRQGMCRRLLDGIEMILSSLNVEKLIIPAIAELVDTWTSKFGFSPLDVSQKQDVKSISMLVFPGTGLLQKPLLKKTSPEEHSRSQEVDGVFSELESGKIFNEANEDSLCSANAKSQGSAVTYYVDSSKDASACNACGSSVGRSGLDREGAFLKIPCSSSSTSIQFVTEEFLQKGVCSIEVGENLVLDIFGQRGEWPCLGVELRQ
uniref:PHD-type domain-containing protein n=1 Tax=Oryza punctata TaxID=4537 RepID=A0A0E0KIZ6_ORYPU